MDEKPVKEKSHTSIFAKASHVFRAANPVYAVLIALIVFAGIYQPRFLTWTVIRNTLVQSTGLGLSAVGQTFVMLTGGIDLSIGPVISLTNSLAADILSQNADALWLVVIVTLAIGLVVGLLNGFAVAYGRLNAFIFTFALGSVLQGLSFEVLYQPGGLVTPALRSIARGSLGPIPLPIIYLVVIFLMAWYVLRRTIYGLRIYAIGGNPDSASLSGVPTRRIIVSVYVISSLCAALAGLFLAARVGSGDPLLGEPFTLDSVTAAAVGGTSLFGGIGGVIGTLAGTLILGILSVILNLSGISSFYQWVVKGLILILALAIDVGKKKR